MGLKQDIINAKVAAVEAAYDAQKRIALTKNQAYQDDLLASKLADQRAGAEEAIADFVMQQRLEKELQNDPNTKILESMKKQAERQKELDEFFGSFKDKFDDFDDIEPELYFTDKEIKLSKQIIKEHCNGEFGTLLISNRYKNEGKELIQQKLDEYNLPMFYWTSTPNSGFEFKKALDLRHVDTRIQLCIKTLATFNIGNQTGVNDTIANYTPTYTVPRGDVGSNYIKSEIYL